MGFIELAIAALQFFGSIFGTFGHVGQVCVNAPVAIHATANSGLETSPTLRFALIGQPPAC
jgi:hypothetical protein